MKRLTLSILTTTLLGWGIFNLVNQHNSKSITLKYNLLSRKLIDTYFLLRGPIAPQNNVVIVAIDQESQEKIGPWPWSHDRIADSIERLMSFAPKSVVLDFPAGTSAPSNTLNLLVKLRDNLEAAKREPMALNDVNEQIQNTEGTWKLSRTLQRHNSKLILLTNNDFPPTDQKHPLLGTILFEELLENQAYSGFTQESDGSMRALRPDSQETGMQPLSDKIAELEKKPFQPVFENNSEVYINYRGPSRSFPHMSVSELFNNRDLAHFSQRDLFFKDQVHLGVDKTEFLRNKIIVLGSSQPLAKSWISPFDRSMSEAEITATEVENALEKDFLHFPAKHRQIELGLVLLTGLVVALIIEYFSVLSALALCGVWITSLLWFNQLFFFHNGILINFLLPLILTPFFLLTLLSAKFLALWFDNKRIIIQPSGKAAKLFDKDSISPA